MLHQNIDQRQVYYFDLGLSINKSIDFSALNFTNSDYFWPLLTNSRPKSPKNSDQPERPSPTNDIRFQA